MAQLARSQTTAQDCSCSRGVKRISSRRAGYANVGRLDGYVAAAMYISVRQSLQYGRSLSAIIRISKHESRVRHCGLGFNAANTVQPHEVVLTSRLDSAACLGCGISVCR